MSYSSTSLPPADDWRLHGECRNHDPELWFPAGTTGPNAVQIEDAKAVCRMCPVLGSCRQWALEQREQHGVWGGMTENDRIAYHRRVSRAQAKDGSGPAPTVREPIIVYPSLQRAYDVCTLADGEHLVWVGGNEVKVDGRRWSPNQVAWRVTRRIASAGRVLPDCDRENCVQHLADQTTRAVRKAAEQAARKAEQAALAAEVRASRCGTRYGYQLHRKHGEEACAPCRQANADTDRRLRNTGTTKPKPKPLPAGIARCGTTDGYKAHKHWQEQPCQSCQKAHDADVEQRQAEARAAAALPSLPTCGTRTGYSEHTARGEAPCTPCTDARARTDWLLRTTTPERSAA